MSTACPTPALPARHPLALAVSLALASPVAVAETITVNSDAGGSSTSDCTLTDAVDRAVDNGKAVHILGLLSPGGVHSHEDQIHAMARLAVERGAERVYLHAFLDGRDMPPKSAESSLKAMDAVFAQLGKGRIATIIGRYYAMDRDHRWERIRQAYDLITLGRAETSANSALEALHEAEIGNGIYGTTGQLRSGHYSLNCDWTAWLWANGGSVFDKNRMFAGGDESITRLPFVRVFSLDTKRYVHVDVDDLAVLVNSPPQLMLLALDLDENLVDRVGVAIAWRTDSGTGVGPGVKSSINILAIAIMTTA